ncbi:RNase adapter RapZ [Arthrobacter sp. MA-N2]|uniref:RNase adapter RapZ n=1 Tax=Arthrobacter sp. MA-N2 TaxID=1101188 RepID=UPI000485E695|nr:RNase adapter RapZ [Arthrobacter sp. MA-N2]
MPEPELLIVTGMSGAGRSSAANALEDHGWRVIDNLPPVLLGALTELLTGTPGQPWKLAVVMDIRGGGFFNDLRQTLRTTLPTDLPYRILFLDASDAVLVSRFEKERRPHPLQTNGRTLEGISAEREALRAVKSAADIVLDTTEMNVHALSTAITKMFSTTGTIVVRVDVMSFGFKHGLPLDANHVADVRFLPNPHWIPALQRLSGLEPQVREYVLEAEGAKDFLDRYVQALVPVINGYRRENKHFVNIAVGCTGGKHRSVVIAEALTARLAQFPNLTANTHHRDVGRE